MNPLTLVMTLTLVSGCTKTVLDTPTGQVTCYSRQCLTDNKEYTGWGRTIARRKAEDAKLQADADQELAERRAWNATHPAEAAQAARDMATYMANRPINAYGCPGTSVPMTWAPWWGPSACGHRSW